MKYEYKYINEAMKNEMETLFEGEHGETLTAWSLECGNAAIAGVKEGLVKGGIRAAGMGALGLVLVAAAAKVTKKFVDKYTRKKVQKLVDRVDD